jgi:hypothetical protein
MAFQRDLQASVNHVAQYLIIYKRHLLECDNEAQHAKLTLHPSKKRYVGEGHEPFTARRRAFLAQLDNYTAMLKRLKSRSCIQKR